MTHTGEHVRREGYDFMKIMSELLSRGIKNADFQKITGTQELNADSDIKNVLVSAMQFLDDFKALLAQGVAVDVLKSQAGERRSELKIMVEKLADKYNSVDTGDPYFFTNWMKALVGGMQMLEIATDIATMQDDFHFLTEEYLGGIL